MSIDAKGIQLLLWRAVRFSGIYCYRFVRKHPLVSGILVFVFFLYMFFPSVFYFLLYSSPLIVCTAASVWFYLKTKHSEFRWINKKKDIDNNKEDSDNKKTLSAKLNRSTERTLRPQKSVRRIARKEVLEWDRKDSEDRDMVFKVSPYYDTLFKKTSFLEENPKLALNGKGDSSKESGESSSNNVCPKSISDSETLKKSHSGSCGGTYESQSVKAADGGGEAEVESLEDGEDEEDDGKKAVEWTVDDQKNLMDLGQSELERNKRLESLIAKRRARKLFKMAIDKNLTVTEKGGIYPPNQIAPILIVKNHLLGATHDQMPGSAPSILLPAQNPFDLPYDPLEEKPNLTGDSFQQEFMAATQKDMFLCRHESFCRGPVYGLETTHDPMDAQINPFSSTQKGPVEAVAVSSFQRFTDKGGRYDSSCIGITNHNKETESSEVRNEKNEKSRETASEGIEIGDKMKTQHDIEPGLDTRREDRMETDSIKNNDSCCSSSSEDLIADQTTKSPGQILNEHVRKNYNLSIPPKARTVNRFPYDSSPSPSDRRRAEFLFYGYRRHGHTPTCSIASDLQVEFSEIGSPPTTDGTNTPADGDSVTYDGDVDRNADSDNDEMWGGSFNLTRTDDRAKQLALESLDGITEEDPVEAEVSGLSRKPEERGANETLNNESSLSSRMDITENDASHPANIEGETHKDVKQIDKDVGQFQTSNVSDTPSPENPGETMHMVEKSEQLIKPQDTPTEDLNIVSDMKPVTHGDANTSDLKSSADIEDESQVLNKTAALGETAVRDGHNTRDAPNSVQSRDGLNSVGDDINGQNVTRDEFSGVKEIIGGSIAMALNRRLMLEQISLSSCSSPRSVLPQNNLADQIPNVEQRIQRDEPAEDIGADDSGDDQPQENLNNNMLQNAQQVIETSTDRGSGNSSLATLEGSFDMTENTTDYNTLHNDSSIKPIEGEPNALMSYKDAEELSEPSGENAKSDVPETMVTEEKPTYSPSKIIEEGNNVEIINNSEVNAKESQPQATNEPEKPNDQDSDVNKIEANERDKAIITETARKEENSVAEVSSSIHDVNDSLTDKATKEEILNHVLDGEGEPQMLSREEAVLVPSKTIRKISAGYVSDTDTKHETKKSTNIAGQLTSAGSISSSLDSDKNGKDVQKSTSQEGDAPKPGKDNVEASENISGIGDINREITINREIAVEESKPTDESAFNALDTEENESKLVANY